MMSNTLNRRQFLRGIGGASLAIPFLPSLLKGAHAQESSPPKIFVAMGYENGAIWGSNFYPNESRLTQSAEYAGRTIRYGNLTGATDDDR